MINNFEQIKGLLTFPTKDIFYFCQILKRRKEHPELISNPYVVKTYYIKSEKDLDFYKGEMICLANYHNARVYINLNQRSFEKTAFHNLKKITDQILNKDYISIRKSYNSVCGMYVTGDKYWIIDIDYFTGYFMKTIDGIILDKICECLATIEPLNTTKMIAKIPTKNGCHLITRPFNIEKFKKEFPDIDVHKNNPTVLYIP